MSVRADKKLNLFQRVFCAASSAQLFEQAPWRSCDVIWREKGLLLRRLFVETARMVFKEAGYEEVLMPAFIPDETLRIQAEHYRDVHYISFRVDDEPSCYLRATSETQFASFLASMNVRKFPYRVFQICSVFRKEAPDRTMPLIRAIEIEPFIETMTFGRASRKELAKEAALYAMFFKKLCIPLKKSIRPPWDTFPEATRTIAFDTVLDGYQVTQVGSVHNLGTSFARALNLTLPSGGLVQHTSGGISGRALLATIAIHFNENQIVLPACLSPFLLFISTVVASRYPSIVESLEKIAGERIYIAREPECAVQIPIRITAYGRRGLEIFSAFGRQYVVEAEGMRKMISKVIAEYDQDLYRLAVARTDRWNKAIDEIPCCGNFVCLLSYITASARPWFLGFEVNSGEDSTCAICQMRSKYVARFAQKVC